MSPAGANSTHTREAVIATLIALLNEMSADWDRGLSGEIGPETLLGRDLGFSSMDLVMLVVEIEQAYHPHNFPFEDLFAPDGQYVEDVDVATVAGFLCRHLPEEGTVFHE